MKTIFRPLCISLALLILLSSCNLPVPAASPTPDLLATQVLLALTNMPTSPATEVPTAAPPPPDLPTPTSPATIADTPTTAPSPTTQPTLPPPPTATPSPEDPTLSLGTPTWQDSFASGTNWNLSGDGYKDDYTHIKIENDAMQLTSLTATGWRGWRLGGRKITNAYLEVTLRTGSCSGADSYGLIARAPDYSSGQGYYFQLTCDGRYNFTVWDASGNRALFSPENNPAILGGSNQTNRIGLWLQGNTIKLYANGKLLREFSDSSIPGPGYFGLFIAGLGSTGFTYFADSIAYWELP
ncbi:MAG: hypothetical protein LDL12_03955 [Anaerolinea sp.]|nr:hypothetical protein [Anaerolinea sp.]